MFLKASFDSNIAEGLARLEKKLRGDILYRSAAAMARIIYAEVKINTSGVRAGTPVPLTGNLDRSIYWAQAKAENAANENKKSYHVSWNKVTAPHGHLLEYGHSGAPAYPFIRPALAHLPRAVRAGIETVKSELAKAND